MNGDDKLPEMKKSGSGQIRPTPSGILRLDIGKPRRSSGGSVEFRNQPELLGEVSI